MPRSRSLLSSILKSLLILGVLGVALSLAAAWKIGAWHLEWQWYRDNLIGATFTAHIMGPQFQTAAVVLENHQHPVLRGLPDIWQHEEEWYSWERSPRTEGFTILATLDENSYLPVADFMGKQWDLRMGDHPVV